MTRQVKAQSAGRRFWIEVPPVEKWFLKFEHFQVGKLENGSLLIVDHYADADRDGGIGWVASVYKNFDAVCKDGSYQNDFLRTLAQSLGIEKMRWQNIWLDMYEYFCNEPEDDEELRAVQERRAALTATTRGPEAAEAFRQKLGLAPKKRRLTLV